MDLREMNNSKFKIQNSKFSCAILPLIIGDETKAVELAAQLRARGIFIPAIRYPTVAHGNARLRVTLTAAHTAKDVSELLATLADFKSEIKN
jgi:7-keto-8-aminopelargonate synthetase-like enzyme